MQMTRPIAVDGTVMTYINVPEDDAPEWSAAAAPYGEGDRAILASTHRVYESLVDNNSDEPEAGSSSVPQTWTNVGATRPWRLYDTLVRNATVSTEPYDPAIYHVDDDATEATGIAITFEPGQRLDTLALLNIAGVAAHVRITNPVDGEIYAERFPLIAAMPEASWWAYFYAPIERQTQLILDDLPITIDATVTLAIEAGEGEAQIGELILGQAAELGSVQYGSSIGTIDYSTKERDAFGNLRIVERRYTRLADYRVSMDRRRTDWVAETLAEARATPSLFVGTTLHSSLVVFGIYRDMRITFENYAFSEATIEVEEV